MKAVDLIVETGRAVSKAEARRLIVQGALRVNDELVITKEGDNVNELELPLVAGDRVKIGRHEITIEQSR